MSIPAELALAAPGSTREASLWLGVGATILAAHLAFAYVFQSFADVAPLPDATEEAMVIDLTPLPVTLPEAVASETIEEEVTDQAEPIEEAVEKVEPEIEEPLESEIAELQPEPEELVEPAPEVVIDDIVVQLPDEVPLPQSKPVEEPVKNVDKPAEKKKPVEKPRETATVKPKDAKPKASAPSTASKASTAPKVNPARWNSQVRAAVARRVGRIRGKSGTVNVRFVVNGSGSVVSASVSRSSGDRTLDAAALKAVRSARVPAPPAGLSGSHSFSIPLTFR